MGQTFRLVCPRARLTMGEYEHGQLGEILFDSTAELLVDHLAVPVRRQYNFLENSSVGSANATCREKQKAKCSRVDNDTPTKFTQRREKIQFHSRSEKTVLRAVITLSSLPTELHLHIYSFIVDMVDVISLSSTNQYFLSLGLECLHDFFASIFGRWAGENIVCVGEDVEPNDYPSGLFSDEVLEVMRQWTMDDSDESNMEIVGSRPFTIADFGDPHVSKAMKLAIPSFHREWLELRCFKRGLREDPGYLHIQPYLYWPNYKCREAYFPTDQQWPLRNLTTKEIVHSNAIALSPIEGPHIRFFGFGDVVMWRICWSGSPVWGLPDNTTRGIWAGHCLDITTLSGHEAETRGEEWRDVSNEVMRETVSLLEACCGADWRNEILKGRGVVSTQAAKRRHGGYEKAANVRGHFNVAIGLAL
ncbi:hypothetical protein F4802DRAFT_615457 [Xylaria palmicola]|nr:hypothetical protein F4802DRAFT_615457 [Xylaria palmicola]